MEVDGYYHQRRSMTSLLDTILHADPKRVDILLQWIANAGQLAVVSIGYRLAPENPFPKPMEDCYDAADWLVDNAEKEYRAPFTFMGGEVSHNNYMIQIMLRLI